MSLKKAFFKNVWDRLHVERGWTSIDDEEPQHADEEASEGEEEEAEGEDGEAVGNQMSALIKAAAIWLNNQDAASDTKGTRSKRAAAAKQGDAEDEFLTDDEDIDSLEYQAAKHLLEAETIISTHTKLFILNS